MKPIDSSIIKSAQEDVYDVFHQTVDKLHGVWQDFLTTKDTKPLEVLHKKQVKKAPSNPRPKSEE